MCRCPEERLVHLCDDAHDTVCVWRQDGPAHLIWIARLRKREHCKNMKSSGARKGGTGRGEQDGVGPEALTGVCLSRCLCVRTFVRVCLCTSARMPMMRGRGRLRCVYVCVCINTTDTVRCKYYVFAHTNEHTYANAHTGVAQQIVHVTSSSEIPDVHAQMALLGVARLSTEVCLSVLIDAFAR